MRAKLGILEEEIAPRRAREHLEILELEELGQRFADAFLIVGDQAPTSVGDFSVGSTGTQLFTSKPAPTPEGATIAITREPQPGNTAPEGPVVSAGIATVPGATG